MQDFLSEKTNNKNIFKEDLIPLLHIINEKEILIENKKNKKKIPLRLIDLCTKCKKKKNFYEYYNNDEGILICKDCLKSNKELEIENLFCRIHNEKYQYYCYHCQQNLCSICFDLHDRHEIINFNNLTEDLGNYNVIIKKKKKEIRDLEIFFKKILDEFKKQFINLENSINEKIKEFKSTLEISKKLFDIYKSKENSLSFEIINNIKVFSSFNTLNFNYEKTSNYFKQLYYISRFLKENYLLRPSNDKIYHKNITKRIEYFTIRNHTLPIQCLLILKDKRLVSASNDGLIIIYKENYQPQLTIHLHNREVYNIIQNNDGEIISCSADSTINVIQLLKDNTYILKQKMKNYLDHVIHIREFSNLNLFSSSLDKTIKIWEKNKYKQYQCVITIKTNEKVYSILELKKHNQFVCSESEKNISFYNIKEYNLKYLRKDIFISGWTNSMCLLNDNLLALGGKNMIILFEISSYEIVKTIRTENQIISIQKFDNGLIYIGDFSGGISQWELNGDNLKFIDQKKNAHSDKVTSILQFDNGIIVSGSNDNTIKIWK